MYASAAVPGRTKGAATSVPSPVTKRPSASAPSRSSSGFSSAFQLAWSTAAISTTRVTGTAGSLRRREAEP